MSPLDSCVHMFKELFEFIFMAVCDVELFHDSEIVMTPAALQTVKFCSVTI